MKINVGCFIMSNINLYLTFNLCEKTRKREDGRKRYRKRRDGEREIEILYTYMSRDKGDLASEIKSKIEEERKRV